MSRYDKAKLQSEFMSLYEPLEKRLWKFCLAMNYNREDARDVLGETVLQAFAGFDKLKNSRAFLSYLFTIASRSNSKMRRRSRRECVAPDDDYFDTLASNSTASEKLEIRELHEALAKLTDEQREAIVLFDLSGFSRREAAQIQNVSEDTLKKRLERGRSKLREILGEPIDHESSALPVMNEEIKAD